MKEIDSMRSGGPVEVREQIAGMWRVDDLVKELYSLADKFIDYKHGLVQIPPARLRSTFINQKNKELTFKPRINAISKEIERRFWQFRLQIEKEEQ